MKYQKREKMYEVNVWELKTFVLEVASFYQLKQLETAILLTCCLDELRSLIKDNSVFHHMLLKQLMNYITVETEAKEIEKHLVYMKLLLNWKDSKYQSFRNQFYGKLKDMIRPYFTSDLYILMRHIVEPNVLRNDKLIKQEDDVQKYFMCEIYLIEEEYKMAYTYLKDCRYVGVLQEYDYELRTYSYLKYKKYILKEPFFNTNVLGDCLWMRKQLKY